jgi:hypothetical protein
MPAFVFTLSTTKTSAMLREHKAASIELLGDRTDVTLNSRSTSMVAELILADPRGLFFHRLFCAPRQPVFFHVAALGLPLTLNEKEFSTYVRREMMAGPVSVRAGHVPLLANIDGTVITAKEACERVTDFQLIVGGSNPLTVAGSGGVEGQLQTLLLSLDPGTGRGWEGVMGYGSNPSIVLVVVSAIDGENWGGAPWQINKVSKHPASGVLVEPRPFETLRDLWKSLPGGDRKPDLNLDHLAPYEFYERVVRRVSGAMSDGVGGGGGDEAEDVATESLRLDVPSSKRSTDGSVTTQLPASDR